MDICLIKNTTEIQRLRELYTSTYFNRRYIGWCDEFDRQFDKNSDWFCLPDKKVFCRVTYKGTQAIPIDKGNESIIPISAEVCEINNFLYQEVTEAITLIDLVFKELEKRGITQIFCIVDPKFKKSYNFTTNIYGFQKFGSELSFPDVLHKKTESKVIWDVLVKKRTESGFSRA